MKNHPHMPADRVPYWDMDAPGIPNEPATHLQRQ